MEHGNNLSNIQKRDIGIVSNYCGISLLDTAYKVLSMALLRRLEIYAEDILTEYQTGFRRGKTTTDYIFTIRRSWKNSTNIIMTFMLF